ncbi:MAG: DUF2634 domain-containing protein [Clostridiales bacterium]|nr:DUF2634 domain-containing protein [Clostridiales bacterium]
MGVFPFINPDVESEVNKDLPMFREYAYDFENQCLKLKDGNTYLVEGNEALRIWIYFALGTARYRYMAYDRAFGSEIEEKLIGQPLGDDVTRMEMERYITEVLMCNPYIQELSDFEFEPIPSGIRVSFQCRTVYGTDQMLYEKAVV